MIRPLRQRHRGIFLALGIALPVAFAVAIAARKPVAETNSVPKEFSPTTVSFTADIWSRADLFPKMPVQVRLRREQSGTGNFAVTLVAAKDFMKPDLLVYWSPGHQSITNTLPSNVILLGAFDSPLLPLPVVAKNSDGLLVLYSLADNEIVDVSIPIRFNQAAIP